MKQTKTQKLVTYLLNESDRWISSNLLSDYLGVSTRQIRKYISKINEDAGENLILSSNQGYRIDSSKYNKEAISEIETPATRVNYIIQKLVSEKDGYNIFDLADELYVSISTIENDLKAVRNSFKKFQLELHRDKDILYITGDEKRKRNLMSNLISSDSYDHFVLKDEVRFLTFHYHYWEFRTTIREIFTRNDIFVNDYTLNNTALHLIITIDRIRNNYILEETEEIKKVQNTRQFHVACQIKEYIEQKYKVHINNAELYNLTLVISNNTTMIDYNFITANNINQYIEQKYIDIAQKVIKKVEECYCLDKFNEDFLTKFTIHLKNLFTRAENNYTIKNPLTSKIKTSFPLIYDIAVFIAQEFQRDYNINLNEDEITFIALHIGAYFENSMKEKTKVNCAFVYADYYSMHQNVLHRILTKFDNLINIKYAISVDHYNPDLIDCDLIISTIDMPFQTQAIIIHPFLTDRDIERLQDIIDKKSKQKKNLMLKSNLLNFFNEQLFYKNPNFQSNDDAIKEMCTDIIQLDYADDSFMEDVYARESMSSTAFHNVAVPHSLRKGAKTSFISIAISDHPLNWGKNNVSIIALIGVSDDSRKIFAEIFDALIDILSEPANVKELIKAENFLEFMKILEKLMESL